MSNEEPQSPRRRVAFIITALLVTAASVAVSLILFPKGIPQSTWGLILKWSWTPIALLSAAACWLSYRKYPSPLVTVVLAVTIVTAVAPWILPAYFGWARAIWFTGVWSLILIEMVRQMGPKRSYLMLILAPFALLSCMSGFPPWSSVLYVWLSVWLMGVASLGNALRPSDAVAPHDDRMSTDPVYRLLYMGVARVTVALILVNVAVGAGILAQGVRWAVVSVIRLWYSTA